MPTIGGKKAAILCLLEILRRYSDIDHPLSMHQLIHYLHQNYGISAERKSVSRNISLLLEMGMDISTYEENHRGYFLREREFDNLELRILIDSVMTSRYIPESDAKRLIHKLESLGSIYFRHQVRHVHSLPSWPHQHNKAFFFNLDLISEAIDRSQKISFTYNQYGTDGRLHPVRRNFIVSPYALIAANTQYYLVANYAKYDNLSHYRVDQITEITILPEENRPIRELPHCPDAIDIGKYAQEHFLMYGGAPERVVLKMDISCAGDVVDVFGANAQMQPLDETYMKVILNVAPEGIRYFIWQFGWHCEVLEPASLRETIWKDLQSIMEKYMEN